MLQSVLDSEDTNHDKTQQILHAVREAGKLEQGTEELKQTDLKEDAEETGKS